MIEPNTGSEGDSVKKCPEESSGRLNVKQTEIFIDGDLLGNIFMNLLGNASKFSPGKTDVWLEVCDAAERLVATVRDQGMGIDEKDKPDIFKPFRRGSNTAGIQGTCLGLCIVKESVQALEASIEVSSSPGRGSVFKVTIPKHLN